MKTITNFSRRSFIKYFSWIAVAALCFSFSASSFAQAPSPKDGDFSGVLKAKNGSMLQFEGGFTVDTSEANIQTVAGGLNLSLPELQVNSPVAARIQADSRSTPNNTVLKAQHVSVNLLPNEVVFVAPIQKLDVASKTITVFSKEISLEDQTLFLSRKKKKAKPSTLSAINSGDIVLVDALLVNGRLVARKVVKVENSPYGDAFTVIGNVETVNLPKIGLSGGVEIELSKFMFNFDILPGDLMYFGFIRSQESTTPPLDKIFSVALARNPRESYLAGRFDNVDLNKNTLTMFNKEIRITSATVFDGDFKSLKALDPNQPIFLTFEVSPNGEVVAKLVNQTDANGK